MATTKATKNSVLVVDDDALLRESLTMVLQTTGHETRSAHDGISGLLEMRGHVPDVILSDLYMSGMSGFEFLSVVRRRFPQVHVIAMSGAFGGPDVPLWVAADAFYPKSTGIETLLHLVDEKVNPRAHTVDSCTSEAPAWLSNSVRDSSGDVYVFLCCPECLRCSKQMIHAEGAMLLGTQCESCGTAIHYAMVQPDPSANPAPDSAGETAVQERRSLSAVLVHAE